MTLPTSTLAEIQPPSGAGIAYAAGGGGGTTKQPCDMKLSKTTKSLLIAVVLVAALAVVDMVFSATPLDHKDLNRLASKLDGTKQVNWKWLDGPRNRLGERYGLCVSYRAVSNTVVIPRYLEPVAFDDIMLPSYVHELCHATQRRRMGSTHYFVVKTFCRGKLETEAIREEKRAQKILGVNVL